MVLKPLSGVRRQGRCAMNVMNEIAEAYAHNPAASPREFIAAASEG